MSALVDSNALDSVNPSLTRYGRRDPAPVLPLREEPDLLSWLETSGRLVADEESGSPEVSTVEEEELSLGNTFFPVPPLPLTACYMRCRAQILLPAGSLR